MSASKLGSFDIVLTTFDVLRSELHRCGAEGGPSSGLRRAKRYEVVPTPLTRLKWHRIVLDEAQLIESGASAAGAMAAKLTATHKARGTLKRATRSCFMKSCSPQASLLLT